MIDFTTANANAVIIFGILLIVFLLTYIAFGPSRKQNRSK